MATVGGACLAGGLLIAQPGLHADSPLLIALAVALALAVVMKETYPPPAAASPFDRR
jgi:hypothetical protein